jgi:hypothetical protein
VAKAILQYQADHGYLPADIVDPKSGKALLSWRVLILPYIEMRAVYNGFKQDEAWDSPHNRRAAMNRIKVLDSGDVSKENYGLTRLVRYTGPNTLHQPGKKWDLRRTPDGPTYTMLLAEVGEAVPWAKPSDPPLELATPNGPFVAKEPPVRRGPYADQLIAAFADGSVRSLRPDLPGVQFESLIWINDALVLPEWGDLVAVPAGEQEPEDVRALLATARDVAERLGKLNEEEAALRAELSRLRKKPEDRVGPLANRLLEQIDLLQQALAQVGKLREEVEKENAAQQK